MIDVTTATALLRSNGWYTRGNGWVDPQGATGEPMPLERALAQLAEYDRLAEKYDEA